MNKRRPLVEGLTEKEEQLSEAEKDFVYGPEAAKTNADHDRSGILKAGDGARTAIMGFSILLLQIWNSLSGGSCCRRHRVCSVR